MITSVVEGVIRLAEINPFCAVTPVNLAWFSLRAGCFLESQSDSVSRLAEVTEVR